jgi:antitoxin VapB
VSTIAKLFWNGRSQAVRLPAEFRFPGEEVYVRRDPATGDVILSSRADAWDAFFHLVESAERSTAVPPSAPNVIAVDR